MILNISTSYSAYSDISSSSSTSRRAPRPTPTRASSGHSVNQSIVQQLTKEGKRRRRIVNASPRGDIAITKWMLFFTRVKYWEKMFILFGWMLRFRHSPLQASTRGEGGRRESEWVRTSRIRLVTDLLHILFIVYVGDVAWIKNRIEILAHLLMNDLRVYEEKGNREVVESSHLEHVFDIFSPVLQRVVLDHFNLIQSI